MTDWFERRAGELAAIQSLSPMGEQADEPVMLLFTNDAPDWVRMPPELDASERVLEVLRTFAVSCPKCHGATGTVRHLELSEGYYVAQCELVCGFVWYQLPEEG